MRKPLRMLKLALIYHKSISVDLVSEIQKLNSLEIVSPRALPLVISWDQKSSESIVMYELKLKDLINKLKSIVSTSKLFNPRINRESVRGVDELLHHCNQIVVLEKKLQSIFQRIDDLKKELEELESKEKKLEYLCSFGINPEHLKTPYYRIHLYASQDRLMPEQKPPELYYLGKHRCSHIYVSLQPVSLNIEEVDFEGYKTLSELETVLALTKQELKNKSEELSLLIEKADTIYTETNEELSQLLYELTVWRMRFDVLSGMGKTQTLNVLEAWIAEKDYEKISRYLASIFGKNLVILIEGDSEHLEDAPTVLQNKEQIVKPFEYIVRLMSLPSANELDPSTIFLFTLSFTYGMIVGDVGYGIVSFFIADFLQKKYRNSPMAYNIAGFWKVGAVATVLFGLIFDEYFAIHFKDLVKLLFNIDVNTTLLGLLGINLYLNRITQLPLLLGYTVIIGSIYMALGFLLGFINEFSHSKKHALAKLAWFMIIVAGYLVIPNFFFGSSFINLFAKEVELYLGISLFLASAIILVYAEGVAGIFEIPGLAGNVFSFMRIGAVGIAGVILAEIINEAFLHSNRDMFMYLVSTLLFIVLHTLNIILAMVEGTIQGARLNVVEFSTKFFRGSGREFRPFGYPAFSESSDST